MSGQLASATRGESRAVSTIEIVSKERILLDFICETSVKRLKGGLRNHRRTNFGARLVRSAAAIKRQPHSSTKSTVRQGIT